MLENGKYYVGDLSVVLSPEEVKHLEQFPDGYCSLPDGKTMWKKTIENGSYRTSWGNHLSVSIGVVGVLPFIQKYEQNEYVVNINKFGMVYTKFDSKIDVKFINGDIHINDLVIDTNKDGYFGGEVDTSVQPEITGNIQVTQI